MKQFHHVGVPTTQKRDNEIYLDGGKLYVTDAEASPYRIEWLRFEDGSPLPAELKTQPHIAFLVDDMAAALAGKRVLIEPFEPMPGVKVAFIIDDGALIEFMHKAS